jgi:hypothetical protein
MRGRREQIASTTAATSATAADLDSVRGTCEGQPDLTGALETGIRITTTWLPPWRGA